MIYIRVYDLCRENCIAQKHATALHEIIHAELHAGRKVELDFAGTRRFLTIFFNLAVGQLYRDIPADVIERSLKVTNLEDLGQRVYLDAIDSAKLYYNDSEYRKAVDSVNAEEELACA